MPSLSTEETAERVLVFLVLCACVMYIAKILYNFRDMGLAVRRHDETSQVLSVLEEDRDRDD